MLTTFLAGTQQTSMMILGISFGREMELLTKSAHFESNLSDLGECNNTHYNKSVGEYLFCVGLLLAVSKESLHTPISSFHSIYGFKLLRGYVSAFDKAHGMSRNDF